jgi:hypothetical protein
MTWPQFTRWLSDPSLDWKHQHPIAHAAGGVAFCLIAILDLFLLRQHAYINLLTALAVEIALAVPMVQEENQHRPMQVHLIVAPLGLVWALGFVFAYVLPWPAVPWAVASACQWTWELLQRSAWLDAQGHSTYPWYSVVLDASTASGTAALAALGAHTLGVT